MYTVLDMGAGGHTDPTIRANYIGASEAHHLFPERSKYSKPDNLVMSKAMGESSSPLSKANEAKADVGRCFERGALDLANLWGHEITEFQKTLVHEGFPGLLATPDALDRDGCPVNIKTTCADSISRSWVDGMPFRYWCQLQVEMAMLGKDSGGLVVCVFTDRGVKLLPRARGMTWVGKKEREVLTAKRDDEFLAELLLRAQSFLRKRDRVALIMEGLDFL